MIVGALINRILSHVWGARQAKALGEKPGIRGWSVEHADRRHDRNIVSHRLYTLLRQHWFT